MDRFDRPRQALAICLSALAGYVDAIGFLSADRYFVSFMSGNTTRLAVELMTTPAQALIPALLLAGFTLGVAIGGVIAALAGAWRKPAVLALVTLLLLVAAAAHAAHRDGLATTAMVLAMGAVNNTFQRNGEIAVGLTYMTGALVRLGQGLAALALGQKRSGWLAHLLLWSGLFAGAVAGAFAFTRIGGVALWLATAIAAGLALFALHLTRREAA